MNEHTLIKIHEIVTFSVNDSEFLWGFNIESPDLLYKTDSYDIILIGWILGKKAQVVSIEAISRGRVIQTVAVDRPRPDVIEVYSQLSQAVNCGFFTKVAVSELSTEVELLLQVVFSDQSRLPIAVVKFQKKLPFLEQVKADLERSRTRLEQIQSELGRSQSQSPKPQQHDFDPSRSGLQKSKQEFQTATQINLSSQLSSQPLAKTVVSKPGIAASTSTNASILNYSSGLSDPEWFELVIKSIEHRTVDGVELPRMPSDEMQRNTVGSSGEHALREGFNFYCGIKQYAANLGLVLNRDSSILDFGCGWGRIIRFFLKDVAAENLYGIDVDPQLLDICLQTVGHGNYSKVNPLPPSGFPDNSFDIVYAFSVFSHLAEPVHIKWVEEFSKILKPGGILVATTQARSFIELCRSLRGKIHDFAWYNALAGSFVDTDAALADYDSGKFLYSATGGGEVRDASFYGEAVISPAYVKLKWTKYLTFCDFVDDPARCQQSIIVMQKPV